MDKQQKRNNELKSIQSKFRKGKIGMRVALIRLKDVENRYSELGMIDKSDWLF